MTANPLNFFGVCVNFGVPGPTMSSYVSCFSSAYPAVSMAPLGMYVTLDKLADMADRIVDMVTPSIAAVHVPPTGPSVSTEVASLRAEITRLKEQMRSLAVQPHSPRRHSPTPARRCSPSPFQPLPAGDHTLCWYHERFGDAATKCRQPCSKGLNYQAGRSRRRVPSRLFYVSDRSCSIMH